MNRSHRSGVRIPVLALLLATPAVAWQDTVPDAPRTDPTEPEVKAVTSVDARASQFQSSSKSSVALDVDAHGRTVAVWHSRRQQWGTYGVYARRFEADGSPLGDEVRVNETTASHQSAPAVALDGSGTAWFAWSSHGQDGDQGSIVVRRFDAVLGSATEEVVVNEYVQGDQKEARIASDERGNAVVVWTSPVEGGDHRHVFARRLTPAGAVSGPAFRIDGGAQGSSRHPSLALAAGGSFVVTWARVDASGQPDGVFARAFDAEGRGGEEFRISPQGAGGIEPALASIDAERFVACWFQQHEGDWRLAHGGFRLAEEGAVELDPPALIAAPETGYDSGATVAARAGGGYALAWNRFGIAPAQHADLYLATFDADGQALRTPFLATQQSEGHQRIAQADGARLLHFADDGRLTVAWTGDAGLGDHHAAHVSWHAGDGAVLAAAEVPAQAVTTFAQEARPHTPPTYTPGSGMQPLQPVPTLHFLTGLLGFTGITYTGWDPPDPELAVGPDHLVQVTNGGIAFFTKSGNATFQDQIEGSNGFWGSEGATGFVFDPEVIYDPYTDRFFAMACERGSDNLPYFLLAVSDDSDPNGTWFKYRINVQPDAGDTDIDSPNMGVDDQAVYLTADFFGPDKYLVFVIEKAPLLSGGAINSASTVLSGRQSLGIPVSYGSPPRQYMIWSPEGGASNTLSIYAIDNPLTGPALVSTTVNVPNFTQPENPPQAGTSLRPETFESRFWSCMYRNGSLWATHHVNSNRVRQRWYEIDMANWPVSGTPTLVQSGEIDLGGDLRTFFGSIAVDADNNMGITFSRSSPSEFISMSYAWRAAGDPLGTTRPAVIAQTSGGPETSFGRWGDYSGIGPDPDVVGVFWAAHEYLPGGSSWNTWIQSFSTSDPLQTYCSTSPNSVGPGATISATGSTSASANDLTLTAQGAPSNVPGLFFYGPNETQTPLGNGWLCVSGSIQRFPVTTTDGLGSASYLVNNLGPFVNGAFVAGSTWKFQYWYRDTGVGLGFNLTNGLSANFLP